MGAGMAARVEQTQRLKHGYSNVYRAASFTSRALTLLQTSAHLIHMQLTSDGSCSTENCDLT